MNDPKLPVPRYTGYDYDVGHSKDYEKFLQDREFNRATNSAIAAASDM